jgi:hypothetical protein
MMSRAVNKKEEEQERRTAEERLEKRQNSVLECVETPRPEKPCEKPRRR